MSGGDDQLRIILDQLSQLLGIPPPPMITPDQLATGASSISQLLRALGAAANAGDADDYGEALSGHDERESKTSDALAKFPANEEQAAAQLAGVGGSGEMGQMLQQMPQMASGIAGGIAGVLGGVLQPLSQIPQQLAQAGQQAMQAGMGIMQQSAGAGEEAPEELAGAEAASGGAGGDFSGAGGGGGNGGGGIEGTTPTAILGPPPTPSAGTVPASSQAMTSAPAAAPEPAPAQRGAMGAMPMMPPGSMQGAGGTSGETKADTKRIVGPTVKNGAPVQGRITVPPPMPAVTKKVDGKPVATRRIALPDVTRDDEGR